VEGLACLKSVRVSVEIWTEAECFRQSSSYRAVGCGCSGAAASPTNMSRTRPYSDIVFLPRLSFIFRQYQPDR
jgi:hypothetical protein